MMDAKEEKMLEHYKNVIENRFFAEYDILGFLIFIRRHLNKDNAYIREFADLIAHRERDRGIVVDCITASIENNYQTEQGSNKVIGYNGLHYEQWEKEWTSLGEKLGIAFDQKIIKEITLCIFSLTQHTHYNDKKGHSGKIDLFQGNDSSLALATSTDDIHSPLVGFAKLDNVNFVRELPAGHLNKPVDTKRTNGKLFLLDDDGYILNV